MPVRLCLAALPGQAIEDIERVSSHVQALEQASDFLRSRPWTLVSTYNTAGAGKDIVERGERGSAAVLSPRAAALFGLEVLAADIASDPENRTRFWLVARPGGFVPGRSGRGRRRLAHDRGVRRSGTSPDAAGRAPLVRGSRRQPLQARVATQPRTRLGVRVLGRPRPGDRRPCDRRRPGRPRPRTTLVRVLGSYRRAAD